MAAGYQRALAAKICERYGGDKGRGSRPNPTSPLVSFSRAAADIRALGAK